MTIIFRLYRTEIEEWCTVSNNNRYKSTELPTNQKYCIFSYYIKFNRMFFEPEHNKFAVMPNLWESRNPSPFSELVHHTFQICQNVPNENEVYLQLAKYVDFNDRRDTTAYHVPNAPWHRLNSNRNFSAHCKSENYQFNLTLNCRNNDSWTVEKFNSNSSTIEMPTRSEGLTAYQAKMLIGLIMSRTNEFLPLFFLKSLIIFYQNISDKNHQIHLLHV